MRRADIWLAFRDAVVTACSSVSSVGLKAPHAELTGIAVAGAGNASGFDGRTRLGLCARASVPARGSEWRRWAPRRRSDRVWRGKRARPGQAGAGGGREPGRGGGTTGRTRLRIGHAWSAMGRHTREFQRRWAAAYAGVELELIRTNSATGGLAEGLCDIAVLRAPADDRQFASAVVGHERRSCAVAGRRPWATRRSIRLAEIAARTVLIDRRTGTTTPDLWPAGGQPPMRETRDIDDWLDLIPGTMASSESGMPR